jgi:hypothetical protein
MATSARQPAEGWQQPPRPLRAPDLAAGRLMAARFSRRPAGRFAHSRKPRIDFRFVLAPHRAKLPTIPADRAPPVPVGPNEKTARPPLKGAEPMGRKLMRANWEEHSLAVTASVIATTAGIAAGRATAASAVAPRSGRALPWRTITWCALSRRTVTWGALPGRVIAGAFANYRWRDP